MPATPARRPDLVDMMAGTPAHQRAMEQSDLENLLKAAMEEATSGDASSTENDDTKIEQFQSLFRTLVSECIVGLLDTSDATARDALALQAPGILVLLENRIKAFPKLLLATPSPLEGLPGNKLRLPLYRWLVPRLLHGASVLCFENERTATGHKMLGAVLNIIRTVGNSVEENEQVGCINLAGELLRGLSESCLYLISDKSAVLSSVMIATTSGSTVSSQYMMDVQSKTGLEENPLYPVSIDNPTKRVNLALCLNHVIIRSFDTPMYSGTWKDFFADVALSLPISLDRIWHFLGPRFNPRESNKRLSESVAARQRVYFHRDLQVILRRKEVFPNTVSDRAASILIQSAATRFEADEDTAMNAGDTEDDNASVMNRIVCSALEDLNQQRAGRSNGSAWLALLREIETYMLHGRHQKSSPVFKAALRALLMAPGASVSQLCSLIPPSLVSELSLSMEGDGQTYGPISLIVERLRCLQISSASEQQRGTKRKGTKSATGPSRSDWSIRRTANDDAMRCVADIGILNTQEHPGSNTYYAPNKSDMPLPLSTIPLAAWQSLISIFLLANDLAADDPLPESLQLDTSEAIESLLSLASQASFEEVVNSALDDIAGPHSTALKDAKPRHRWYNELPRLFCLVARCRGCNGADLSGRRTQGAIEKGFGLTQISLVSWMRFAKALQFEDASTLNASTCLLLQSLRDLLRHAVSRHAGDFEPDRNKVMKELLLSAYRNPQRRVRVLAAQATIALIEALSTKGIVGYSNFSELLSAMKSNAQSSSKPVQETTLCMIGEIAKSIEGFLFADLMAILLEALGRPNIALRGLAHAQLTQISRSRGKSPYSMLSPYFPKISTVLVSGKLDTLNEATQFLGLSRASFVESTILYTVPSLVLREDRSTLETIANVVNKALGILLIDHPMLMPYILKAIFMQKDNAMVKRKSNWFVDSLQDLRVGTYTISMGNLVSQNLVNLLVEIIVDLGDDYTKPKAEVALERLLQQSHPPGQAFGPEAMSNWLKNNMLGIMIGISDIMHDLRGKRTASEKSKVIRSLGGLIDYVGLAMSGFSSQIMAILQSTLPIPQLRLDTLRTWLTFFTVLRFPDVGPHIGTTAAAFVVVWQEMTREEASHAAKLLDYLLVENSDQLGGFFDEVVSLDSIPELTLAAKRVADYTAKWSFKDRVTAILRRCRSDNVALATRSIYDMKQVLLAHQAEILELAKGDSFNVLVGQIYRVLLEVAGRDGEHTEDIRIGSFECIGIIGALDPDRFTLPSKEKTFMMLSNFTDSDEVRDFALHLVDRVLVGAFRTANDTKQQIQLAYAIQELTKFCGFSPKLLQSNSSSGSIALKVRQRWQEFTRNKQTLETITPLLEGRYGVEKIPIKHFQYPIYASSSTYREWIRSWTTDLISVVLEQPEPLANDADERSKALRDAQTIFGSFRGVVRSGQDVAVAHHLLPHLVLYVINLGDEAIRKNIVMEIGSVLQDQVNPTGNFDSDRRTLSAQAIFDLLDHLSRWLQEQQTRLKQETRIRKETLNPRQDKNYLLIADQIRVVDRMNAQIDPELTAQAALQCKAFARSLRSFEQRMSELRNTQGRKDADLQAYYEHLHRIYADLDEPDGMEGVTSKVLEPSLEHQIREHESVGRWTSAQSCWEVRLQQSPDDVQLHIGLLRCLRSLGHYDTLRTHIDGVLTRHPEWQPDLANFKIEAAWVVGDWRSVRDIVESDAVGSEISMAKVLLAIHERDHDRMPAILYEARRELGFAVTASSRQYARAYPAILRLHMLHEVALIRQAGLDIASIDQALGMQGPNKDAAVIHKIDIVRQTLANRLETTLPSFRIRESVLSIRRTAYAESPSNNATLKAEVGAAWIASAKIARKAGHEQTAYSATLQAKLAAAPDVFFQQTKILKATGHPLKALNELENGIRGLYVQAQAEHLRGTRTVPITLDGGQNTSIQAVYDLQLAKAHILSARWAHETGRHDSNEIISRFNEARTLAPREESPYYRLGHYYDSLEGRIDSLTCQQSVVENYCKALKYGTKHIYQMLPRLLTIWLDLGEQIAAEEGKKKRASHTTADSDSVIALSNMNAVVERARRSIQKYQWLTAYPQIVSRIGHPQPEVKLILMKIMVNVVTEFPRQATWLMVGIYHSNGGQSERAKRCFSVFEQVRAVKTGDPMARRILDDGIVFSKDMLRLSIDPGAELNGKDKRTKAQSLNLSLTKSFEWLKNTFPTTMIVPTQEALTCTLPSSAENLRTNNPFSQGFATIIRMRDQIDVMPSLQRPKKIIFVGDDGKDYPFLVKPHDDLRKDARLMDFNSMINKLLKSRSETRKRNMYIRTYAVMPLNEECGMLEWVVNTVPMRAILIKGYDRRDVKTYSSEIYSLLDAARMISPQESGRVFRDKVLPRYSPCVFHEWFFQTWPEPTAWFAARLAYARTLAVMSMVGFVLGLGDRHGENILFDSTTGDTLHVDFNCLFEKGKTFEVSEKVPFRLSPNLVDALGATGVDGVFRRACEIAMELLRENKDSLISVLEAFIHDPLVEWQEAKRREERRNRKQTSDVRHFAEKAMIPIRLKLQGKMGDERSSAALAPPMSVVNQVEVLIKEAVSPINLGGMYVGWAAWL